ncbi:MAG TPA: DUF6438 domain-containing protein [Clostridia bacterium]|nr:DUF6438 domain-containing protein [Clostridia bacterium]
MRNLALVAALFPFVCAPVMAQPDLAASESRVEAVIVTHDDCPEACPVYEIELRPDGRVKYRGKGMVKVFGETAWTIPETQAANIFAEIERSQLMPDPANPAKFLTSGGECAKHPHSVPRSHVYLRIAGHETFPVAPCFSQDITSVVERIDAAVGAEVHTLGKDELAEAQIRAVLEAQREAWNRGDLDGYMAGYWRSAHLTFFGGSGETRGWRETLERYRVRYQSGGRTMGTLTFDQIRVEMLSRDAAFVRARGASPCRTAPTLTGCLRW